MPDFDAVVIGAGVAGLAALAELDRAGLRVLCLEARNRIGGRVFTERDALSPLPIELGAEFVHGRPPETWEIVRSAQLGIYDCTDASVRIKNGIIQTHEDCWEPVEQIMEEMRQTAALGVDEPFSTFLARSTGSDEAKERSASFVEGFNAARQEIVGIASLAKDNEAAEQIDGRRSFRLPGGYDAVPLYLLRRVSEPASKLRLNTPVSAVEWRGGMAKLTFSSLLTGQVRTVGARRVIVTVPLGVLQAPSDSPGAIQWDPVPEQAFAAAARLAFGQVMRVILRFRETFWEQEDHFSDAGFLLSDDRLFPAWWTPLAVRAPLLTGWSAGPHADTLLGKPRSEVIKQAICSLARIMRTEVDRLGEMLDAAYFHDWHADRFSRGAYSYVPAGAFTARQKLAEPIQETLFFAGEATEVNGHSATVHGAIASGRRAAKQIIAIQSG